MTKPDDLIPIRTAMREMSLAFALDVERMAREIVELREANARMETALRRISGAHLIGVNGGERNALLNKTDGKWIVECAIAALPAPIGPEKTP